jgi:hypothetical protein
VLSTAYLAHLALAGLPAAAAATAARQSIFGAVTVAQKIHSPALLASAHTAFVNGMDLALLVSGAIALAGLALTLAFLPRTSTAKTADRLPAKAWRGACKARARAARGELDEFCGIVGTAPTSAVDALVLGEAADPGIRQTRRRQRHRSRRDTRIRRRPIAVD